MKIAQFIAVILISAAIAAGMVAAFDKPRTPGAEVSATGDMAYDRMLRSGILRCGYAYWDGGIMKDKTTGQMTGAWVDLTEAFAKAVGLKVEWTAEVGWGDHPAAIKSGKVDAICAGSWQSAEKAREVGYSTPLTYQDLEGFVRSDEHRFDQTLAAIDRPDVTIAVIDADSVDFLAQEMFPSAKRFALSQLNGTDAEEMMSVMTGKADIAFTNPAIWRQFDKANSGKLRPVAAGHAFRVFGMSFVFANNDARMMNLFNTGSQEILNSGAVDRIVDKWNALYPDMFMKPAKPFAIAAP